MKLPIERKEYFKDLAKNEIGQKANRLPEIYINLKAAELAFMGNELSSNF